MAFRHGIGAKSVQTANDQGMRQREGNETRKRRAERVSVNEKRKKKKSSKLGAVTEIDGQNDPPQPTPPRTIWFGTIGTVAMWSLRAWVISAKAAWPFGSEASNGCDSDMSASRSKTTAGSCWPGEVEVQYS